MVGIASLTSLTVEKISGLTRLQKDITEFFGELENLSIKACSEMTSLWKEEGAWKSLISLRKLELESCDQLVSLTDESGALPQNLKFLSLERCPNLEKLPSGLNYLASLQDFCIFNCPRIACFPGTGLPPMLARLDINSCRALDVQTCNYEGVLMQSNNIENFSRLRILNIYGCSSLTSLPIGNFPSTLKELSVWYCKKLKPGVEYALHHCMSSLERLNIDGWVNFKTIPNKFFVNLTRLRIATCPHLESFPECGLPLNLRELRIRDCKNLKSLPDQMQSLTSLEHLTIYDCPSLNSFPQGGFPLNLKLLRLGDIGVPITEWGLQRVSSLEYFSVRGKCSEVICFPGECLLPTSLRRLYITEAVNLESVSDGLKNLPSLEELIIWKCPKLQSLPNTVLSTLSHLSIMECPLLKQRCLKETGEYWQWIAPIPCVKIDSKNIHELC